MNSTVWDLTKPEVQEAMAWIIDNKLALDLEGECGIGRDCVGLSKGNGYPDYDDEAGRPSDLVPNAYHKHDCLAVLGRGEDPERQLLHWTLYLARRNWKVIQETRPKEEIDNVISLMIHSPWRFVVVSPADLRYPRESQGGVDVKGRIWFDVELSDDAEGVGVANAIGEYLSDDPLNLFPEVITVDDWDWMAEP